MIRLPASQIGLSTDEVREAAASFTRRRQHGDRARISAGAPPPFAHRQRRQAVRRPAMGSLLGATQSSYDEIPSQTLFQPTGPVAHGVREYHTFAFPDSPFLGASPSAGTQNMEESNLNDASNVFDNLVDTGSSTPIPLHKWQDYEDDDTYAYLADEFRDLLSVNGRSSSPLAGSYVEELFPSSARSQLSKDTEKVIGKSSKMLDGQSEEADVPFDPSQLPCLPPLIPLPPLPPYVATPKRGRAPRTTFGKGQRLPNLSPVKSEDSDEDVVEIPSGLTSGVFGRSHRYRRRTETYSWEQSEADSDSDAARDGLFADTPAARSEETGTTPKKRTKDSRNLRGDSAKKAVAFDLPYRTLAGPHSQPSSPASAVLNPTAPDWVPGPSSSGREFPTASPLPRTPRRSMQVYNDRLPASSQPQTPFNRHQGPFNPAQTAPARVTGRLVGRSTEPARSSENENENRIGGSSADSG
ncbi:MAG: hypothetical protein M1814_002191 [Vezdaea aestivalis]|nr:MAG: hypothetical protein M1814_002191 [Vezdaea aestivalis]